MAEHPPNMYSSDFSDTSVEPSALRHLTAQQRDRLTDIVDQYLSAMEKGMPLDREAVLARHPDLAGPLEMYLTSLEELHDAAAGFANQSSAPREPEPAEPDERRLGDFRLIREIGRGGMGVVYEARQISLDRRVALKILPFAAVLDSKQIARFKNEAHAAAQLDHPNIVPVFAVGVERGVHYFAMRLIDGQPLDRAIDELRRAARPAQDPAAEPTAESGQAAAESLVDTLMAEGDLTVETAGGDGRDSILTRQGADQREYFRTVVRLGVQVADALHAAHEFGVVHRDVKPSNLLLDGDGKLWVTDFGLARFQTDANLTRTGDVVGTMRYMSPEQASGRTELIDRRSDVYSLGATLYELLTLRAAFEDEDTGTLLRRIQQEEPSRPRQLQPRIPRDLETVVLKAMSKQRGERYRTARQFADDLQRILDGKPTVAKPPTLAQRLGKWAARHRRLVTAAAAACLVAFAGMAVGTLLIAREKTKTQQNFARAEKNFRDAREAVDRFGAELAERLAEVPGADEVRGELLEQTLRYYRDFAEQAKGDPTLQSDLAMTYGKIGTLAGEIGSAEEAIDAHRNALAIFEQLVQREPNRPEHRRRLAVCQNNLGLALAQSGQVQEARQAHRAAADIQTALVEQDKTVERYVTDLALSYNNLGMAEAKIGLDKEAEKSFAEAVRLQQRTLGKDPENTDLLRNLAASLNNLASLIARQDPARAAILYEQVLAYQAKAVAAQPAKLKYQNDEALAWNNLGSAQMRLRRNAAAAGSFARAVEIQRELVAKVPAHRPYRRELTVNLNNLGLAQSKLGNTADARHAFEQALTIGESLLRQNQRDAELHSSVGGVHNNLGMIQESFHATDEAAASYAKAVEHQRIAQSQAPSVIRYRRFLSKHYYNLGRVLRQLGRADEAARAALARKTLWPNDPRRLFSVAEELALATSLCAESGGGAMSPEQCADHALDALQEAVAAGLTLPSDLDHNESFASLKTHRRFAELTKR